MQGSARMGEGAGVVVALHPVPAVRLNLLQGRVHHSSYNAVPGTILAHTHTHIFLISVRAGSTDSWAGPVFLTRSGTFFSLKASRCKPSPLAKKREAARVWVKKLRLTARLEGAGRGDVGWCRKAVLYGSVCCTQNSCLLFLWGDKHTILPLFGKTPFFCALN